MRYVQITQTDGIKYFLKVISDNGRFISGIEVTKDGEEVVPVGFHNRTRVVQVSSIKKIVEFRMNNTYCVLEKE